MVRAKLDYPQAKDRAVLLRDEQRRKMTRSAHAYVRGSTLKFYEWLEESSAGKIPEGPAVWICGDCHSGNLGPVASRRGQVAVQIRDLDQTVVGNPAHDLIRLGLSLATAARGSNLPGVTTALMLEHMMEGYEAGLKGESLTPDEETTPKEVRRVLKQSLTRRWKQLARERIQDVKPTIPLGKRFWPLSDAERKAVAALAEDDGLRKLVTSLQHRPDHADIEILDGAYWMKGCSSLGRLRYALLVGVRDNNGSETCLIDIKEAVPAAAPRASGAEMPPNDADRVVAGARPRPADARWLAARPLRGGARAHATGPEARHRASDPRGGQARRALPGPGGRPRPRPTDGHHHEVRLAKDSGAQPLQDPGCPVLAVVGDRRADPEPRGRLP
jgi:uncharacterized protein (DUF2252 family)